VFQSASALTVGLAATPRRVILINGAQARNVCWQVGSAARIEDGSTMVGTIIAPAGVTVSSAGQSMQTTLIGRAMSTARTRRSARHPHTARKQPMTSQSTLRRLRTIGIAGLGSLLALSGWAQEAGYSYGGLAVGQSRANIDTARITSSLLGASLTTSTMSTDQRDTAHKVFGGHPFNRHLAVEGGCFNLGTFGFNATAQPAGSLDGRIKLQGLNLALVGTLPLTNRLSAIGCIGTHYTRTRDQFTGTGAVTVLDPNPVLAASSPRPVLACSTR
jgi:hypothetical protein